VLKKNKRETFYLIISNPLDCMSLQILQISELATVSPFSTISAAEKLISFSAFHSK